MNVGDVFKRVQRSFGDEDSIQVTENDVVRWVNDAQREAVMQHEGLLIAEGYLDTVADQNTYTLPADLFTLTHAFYADDENSAYYALRPSTLSSMNEHVDGWQGSGAGSGRPYVYTKIETGEIVLFPTPDKAVTNGIKVIYSRYPVDVANASSEIDLPVYYHTYVEHYCLMKAYEMDEDWDASDRKAAVLQRTLDFNAHRESWFGRDTYPTVTPLADDV